MKKSWVRQMRRDIMFASLGVIITSFFMYTNYYMANKTYRKFDISPLIYKQDILPVDTQTVHTKIATTDSLENPVVYKAGYKVSVDLLTYEDQYGINTYMELPLETDGKTAKTDSLYQDIEESPSENLSFIKYIKFQCTSVRNIEKLHVHIGGFRFFKGNSLASTKPIVLWNPHTGKRENYTGGPWSDSDQRIIVFCFSEPVLVNRYEIKSSDDLADFDPVNWKIEGSMSGSYWTVLDDRTNTNTVFPIERRKTITYTMNRL